MINEFPHTIVFQEQKRVSDGGGGFKKSWVDALTTEAFVCPVSSRERYLAQQTQTQVDYSVFLPHIVGIKPSMRIKWGTEYLEMKSKPVDQGGQGEIYMIKCASLEVKE